MPAAHSSSFPEDEPYCGTYEEAFGTVPLAIEQIDTLLRLLSARGGELHSFLDLGCNDGVLAAAILGEYPQATGVVIDRTERPIEAARHQLNMHGAQLHFAVANISQPGWERAISGCGFFDAVIAGFATQGLPAPRKRALFGEIHHLLNPGGLFILVEHAASATRWTQELLDDCMIDAVFGEQLRKSGGIPRAQVARDFFASGASVVTDGAPLEVQCDWLKEAGFHSVDCYLRVSEMAVFGGQKPG